MRTRITANTDTFYAVIIIVTIIIIIITFIQYMKQVKNCKSHKNGLIKPGKKKLMKVDEYI